MNRFVKCNAKILALAVCATTCCVIPSVASPLDLGIPAVTMQSNSQGEQTFTVSIQILILMTMLTLLPAGLTIMTSFTRVIIVLAILRQAMGLNQTPSNQVLVGLSLFLTLFIMMPVFQKLYDEALTPYLEERITPAEAVKRAGGPMKGFMLAQTRKTDLALFSDLKGVDEPTADEEVAFSVLVPSFVTSELKTAFQIGFLIFIPFLIIDLVVASVLMAMGMMMLSPMLISLPFKIMLFVLIDGWALTVGTLASSFMT